MWNEGLKLHARLFYTLMELKKLDELHSTVFNEIHQHGNPLVDRGGDEEKSIQIQAAVRRALRHQSGGLHQGCALLSASTRR